MSVTMHLRIKKDYATAIIEDLQRLDAVEVVPEEELHAKPKFDASSFRGKTTPMTNEEIDQQLNNLRGEWERNI